MEKGQLSLTPSEFVALTNQTLEYAYPSVELVGEVASFKINQGKFAFFDIKDSDASVGCFMMAFQLRVALEDGMKVVIVAQPKLTQWGKFSLTVRSVKPVGEGSLKRNFELLKAKLEKEGLFASGRKRILPEIPSRVAVISSTQAAGYGDFVKILDERWGGLSVDVAHTQVQGTVAAEQIVRALQHFNESSINYDVLVVVRGGGSMDDLAVFNDEVLVRAIASSRIPTLVGIGHEEDVTLIDLAADKRASTPTNAGQLLVPHKKEFLQGVDSRLQTALLRAQHSFDDQGEVLRRSMDKLFGLLGDRFSALEQRHGYLIRSLHQLNPQNILNRGYSIVRLENGRGLAGVGEGDMLDISTREFKMKAEVKDVERK